jgi:REP element-mobilizing transposase RayT
MTAPRQVLRGATYLVTRRCAHRQYFLRPSKAANQVFLYLLAVAADRYGIQVHAYCVMSNHYHLVVTDPSASLPSCLQFLDGLVARAINSLLGRRDDFFWGPDSFSAVELVGPEAIIDKATYTLANPVAAGLVRSAHRWPGLWSPPESIGAEALQVERPKHFFDPKGSMPVSVSLRLTTPPGFPTAEAFRERLRAVLAEKEAEAVKKIGTFLGAARVLAQRTTNRPRNCEPLRQLNPRVASRDEGLRIAALARLLSFLSDYRQALKAWREGARSVLFPPGTYLIRVAHGAACAGAG